MVDVVKEFLSNYPEGIRKISLELRKMARKTMPGAHEFLYYDAINYSIGDSPLERVCYISPLEKYVTLGLLFGAQLDDLHHLLQGSGKRAGRVTISPLEVTLHSALPMMFIAWLTDVVDVVIKLRPMLRLRSF